jgi:Fungal specific transcription factor domain
MDGLIRMIACRGGLEKLNWSLQGKVCMFVSFHFFFYNTTNGGRADLVGSVRSDLTPRFPFFDNGMDLQPILMEIPKRSICPGFQAIIAIFGLDNEIISLLVDVQYLTDHIIYLRSKTISSNLLEIDHMAAQLRHRLLSCVSARQTTTQKQIISECCRLGALIHLKTSLQAFPFRVRFDDILPDKLKYCIERVDFTSEPMYPVIDLVVWALCLCGIAGSASLNGAWFVARLSSVASEFQILTVNGIKSILKKFFWVDSMHEGLILSLWSELVFDNSAKQKRNVHVVYMRPRN